MYLKFYYGECLNLIMCPYWQAEQPKAQMERKNMKLHEIYLKYP